MSDRISLFILKLEGLVQVEAADGHLGSSAQRGWRMERAIKLENLCLHFKIILSFK